MGPRHFLMNESTHIVNKGLLQADDAYLRCSIGILMQSDSLRALFELFKVDPTKAGKSVTALLK